MEQWNRLDSGHHELHVRIWRHRWRYVIILILAWGTSSRIVAIHISEEIAQPGRRVPQVIIMTMCVGLATALPLFIALMFFMTDLDAVANSPLPSMELVYQA